MGFAFSSYEKMHVGNIQVKVDIPLDIVADLYNYVVTVKQSLIKAQGFEGGQVPRLYIQKNYHAALIDHLTEVLYLHYARDRAAQQLHQQGAVLISQPLITGTSIVHDQDNNYFSFENERINIDPRSTLKHGKVKFPPRKRYKDLDRQAELIATQERSNKTRRESQAIEAGDWVQFRLVLVDAHTKKPILREHAQRFWLRMSSEEINRESFELFVGKKQGEVFFSDASLLNYSIAPHGTIRYVFQVTIETVIPHSFFCIDTFQSYFSLKNNKDIHAKLIEVLSFRNDISLRREMSELALQFVAKHAYCGVPRRLLEAQHNLIASRVVHNPDYLVYQAKRDFGQKIVMLAERQTKELMIVEWIAYHESITVSDQDIALYMGFIQRPRLRDFLYFDCPHFRESIQERPISHAVIEMATRREKALNYLIGALADGS